MDYRKRYTDRRRLYSTVKNPDPKDRALISPLRGSVCSEITDGIMEWWKNGILEMKNG